ncbi:GDP-mannose mannosyl hydrolase [bacterium endosymbiont of Escarpia laminata]|nr:MAG: GDP-mannose mannosyl hydrolase [bacterium endosymbiont of Escarpia laminata]
MHLPGDVFQTVVASTPLVSIDLVVENGRGEILLGLRNNRPAQGCWFVPGGRILKNEGLDAAFTRLARDELGVVTRRSFACFLGVYEHFYSDSVFGETPETHYVVLGYHLRQDLDLSRLPSSQHRDYRWWPQAEMAASDRVHSNSRAYLSALKEIAHHTKARDLQKGSKW